MCPEVTVGRLEPYAVPTKTHKEVSDAPVRPRDVTNTVTC